MTKQSHVPCTSVIITISVIKCSVNILQYQIRYFLHDVYVLVCKTLPPILFFLHAITQHLPLRVRALFLVFCPRTEVHDDGYHERTVSIKRLMLKVYFTTKVALQPWLHPFATGLNVFLIWCQIFDTDVFWSSAAAKIFLEVEVDTIRKWNDYTFVIWNVNSSNTSHVSILSRQCDVILGLLGKLP